MLVDSHCHIDIPEFAEELDELIMRARAAGVGRLVTITTRVRRLPRALAVAERYPEVFTSVGTHPYHAHEEKPTPAELIAAAAHPKVVAYGEAGLDYHYEDAPREDQAEGFRNHIAAARESGLPVVIHARDADEDIAAILEDEAGKGAFPFVLHCFSASEELAATGVRLGGYVSFSGILTFPKVVFLRDIACELPADRILVETDAPYLAPVPYRGKRNEPSYVAHTARVLAETRGVSEEEIAAITTDNFFRLFSKVPRELES